jgi:hypothetical protein
MGRLSGIVCALRDVDVRNRRSEGWSSATGSVTGSPALACASGMKGTATAARFDVRVTRFGLAFRSATSLPHPFLVALHNNAMARCSQASCAAQQ